MRCPGLRILFVIASICPLLAQQRVDPRNLYERLVLVVPMVGQGTFDDPRRPLFAPLPQERAAAPTREGIIGFASQLSDDGTFALLELVAQDRAAFSAILADRRPDVKVFEKGQARREVIEQEFRKHKKDFNLNSFVGVSVP